MRILLATIAVVAVAIAAVVIAVDRTRGTGDAVSALPTPPLVTAAPQVVPLPGGAPAPTPAGLAAALGPAAANPDLGSFSGTVSDAETGQELWSVGPESPKLPASTTKVLTAAAALLTLPGDQRVPTTLVEGDEPGRIVLVAGGDPTLTAMPPGTSGYYPGAARVSDLVEQIRSQGVQPTSLVVDTGIYSGPAMASGWFPEDVGAGFITPTEPVMIDGGRLDPLRDESPRSPSPALDAGRTIASALGIDPATVVAGSAAEGANVLAEVRSAPLRDRLQQMMEHSDNVLAEAIGREIAIHAGAAGSFDGAAAAIGQALYTAGFDMTGLVMHDASGLSVDDRVTPRLLDQILTAAAAGEHTELRPMLDYLPVAGSTGSLSDRYASGNRDGAGWVRAKTGTLSEASGLAGYVVDQSGRVLTFALLSNGRPPHESRPALDALAATLRNCGCT
ncbi:D-alanyl-D-alanine carboxypeptidase/D-alanyl-D-alanine-endopeptidase [Rhodococcus triatomae]|nr:D-alanyl-D-alanine carboxypeptidase/D-alanyl-D-alanine-endopeptidase [Rhodococcus triatomae]QNG21096.1 D-alanyl-D-alanine carboxypeptidase/D-alanyl-D-alanine-endopeptidase [Rhodococcus triatomae]QNG25612.1 D-alanyl-D-alanine carboxypeptidase/D-alanyl-D-alanine-endopeptidase [Rhodococcus triatomae]